MTMRLIFISLISTFVCVESASLEPEVVKIIDQLIAALNDPVIKNSDAVINNMLDNDKECINWYWSQVKSIEEKEKTARKCPSCQLALRCLGSGQKCFTEDNCCYSFTVLDRVEKLKGTHDKCKQKSGLTAMFAFIKVKITTSDDAADWLMKKARSEIETKCPVKSASDAKCNKGSNGSNGSKAQPAEGDGSTKNGGTANGSNAGSGSSNGTVSGQKGGKKSSADRSTHFVLFYVSILTIVANILSFY